MKKIQYSKFKHGQRVTCEIDGKKVDDAKIAIDEYGSIFICQNKIYGCATVAKFGYKCSFCIFADKDGVLNDRVTNLKFLPRTLDDLEEGDVLVIKNEGEKTVLGVCGKVYFLSCWNDFEIASGDCFTLDEIKRDGYTLKQEEPEEDKLDLRSPESEKMRGESRATRFDFVPQKGEVYFTYKFFQKSNGLSELFIWGEDSFDYSDWNNGFVKRTEDECKAHGEKYARYFLTE